MRTARFGPALLAIGALLAAAFAGAAGDDTASAAARPALQATGTAVTTETPAAMAATPVATASVAATATVANTATAEATATATATGTAAPTATGTAAATATTTATPLAPPPPPPGLPTDAASSAPYRLYVPLAYRAAGSWDSGIQVQNVGGADATVYVSFFSQGTLIASGQPATIAAAGSRTYYLPAEGGIPSGFAGSVVIGASGPVAAVVNATNYNVNGSGKSSTTAYNAIDVTEAGTTVALPALRWGAILQIQNAGSQQTTAHVQTFNEGGLATGVQDFTLNPGQAVAVDLGYARSAQGGNAVSAVVTSTGPTPQPLAVIETGEIASPSGVPMAVSFPGVAKPAPNLAAPLLMRRPTGWGTELAIQNLGSQTAQVSIQYFDQTGAPIANANENLFIPANGMDVRRQNDNASLPSDFVGSALVTAANGQPLAIAVLQSNPNLNQATNYTGVDLGTAATTLYAPLLMKANNGWNTGLQVQNTGNTPAAVTVTYYPRDSNTPISIQSQTLQPNAPATFYTPDAPSLPDTFVGSAVVTSTSGQRLVGVVNEVNYQIGNGGDNSLTYVLVGGQ